MKQSPQANAASGPSRRSFLKGGGMMLAGGAIVGGNLSVARGAHAFGSDTIKIGLVGCGRQGTSLAVEMLRTSGGQIKLVAMADLFASSMQSAFRSLKGAHPNRVEVSTDERFLGLDAFQRVMQSEADVVILATPPGFRPQHFEAAVAAGKHVFMEKPVAIDAVGIRRVLAANEHAKAHALAVQVGLQRRHDPRYRQCVSRLQEGAIGELVFARAYWNGGAVKMRPRDSRQSELEYQLRNWKQFTWLSGDHINEQHIHNLDVINWLVQSHPIEAQGQGGRSAIDPSAAGQTFDHHMVEFTYQSGLKLLSQCRHLPGCWNNVGEHVHATAGTADISNSLIRDAQGNKLWQSETQKGSGGGSQQQLADFISAVRKGESPNEVAVAAESTMTAILGREATYSGRLVRWDEALESQLQLADSDSLCSLDDDAPVQPDASGLYPTAIPGA